MIRAFKDSDCYMPLAKACKREKEITTMIYMSDSRFLRDIWKASEVAYTFCDKSGTPLVVWGFTAKGWFWMFFADSIKELPMSFYKEGMEVMDAAVARYGRIATTALVDTAEEIRFHKIFYKIGKMTVTKIYEDCGHRWADAERRYTP